jgi:hypothetical protein
MPARANRFVVTPPGGRLEDGITVGLVIVLITALTAAFLLRTPGIPVGAPRLEFRAHPLAAGAPVGNLDTIEIEGRRANVDSQPISLRVNESITVAGWAIDPATGAPPDELIARIDDGPPSRARFEILRYDIAKQLQDRAALLSGFVVTVQSESTGRHRLSLSMTSRGRSITLHEPVQLDVAP